MFFRRRHHSPLCKLLLVLFGFVLGRKAGSCSRSEADQEKQRAKLRQFRNKVREAFDVFREEEEPVKEAPAAEEKN